MPHFLSRSFIALFGLAAIAMLVQADQPSSGPTNKSDPPLKVAVLVFPGVELLDFAGPAEIFAGCRDAEGNRLFEVYTVGLSKKSIESMHFLSVNPKYDPTDAPIPDVLVIPGGNVIPVMDDPSMMKWIEQQSKSKCIMFSVCNGASVLAKLGLLDGLQVTTHHSNVEILQLLAPKTICLRDRRFIDNGQIVTTAGVSAGIDGALYLVARLKGIEAAHRSATNAEFDYWAGFRSKNEALPERGKDGTISLTGRIHEDEQRWAVMELLSIIRDKGVDAALVAYPKLLEASHGHDREMIEEAGLDETAWWLFTHSRDREVGLSVLRFIATAYPESSKAQQRLGQALLECGMKAQAKEALEKAIKIDPQNKDAQTALKLCHS